MNNPTNNELIPLVKDTISYEELKNLSDWILTNPRLTKGPETTIFEREFSEWLGVKHSVFCNSGSSAILLMLHALQIAKRMKNNKVVVPSLAWATDLSSPMILGMHPIICDINDKNLSVSLYELEEIFKRENPAVLLLVSVLGIPPEMNKIVDLCKLHNVILLEDSCESMGSEFEGKKLGTFGDMSCFSFYYGHHSSTIEGGTISTDDEELYEILKSIRSHGWDRDSSDEYRKELREKWNVSDFNGLYTFYHTGFNLRSTDLQAFIGRGQIKRFNEFFTKRNENYELYKDNLKTKWKPSEPKNTFVSNFCFPIIHERREEIIRDLLFNNIECRPLICGSMGTQPMYIEKYGRQELNVASYIDKYGFYVPNNHQITKEEILKVCSIINKYCE